MLTVRQFLFYSSLNFTFFLELFLVTFPLPLPSFWKKKTNINIFFLVISEDLTLHVQDWRLSLNISEIENFSKYLFYSVWEEKHLHFQIPGKQSTLLFGWVVNISCFF